MTALESLGLAIRRPTLDDLEATVALYQEADRDEHGEPDTDLDETRDFWREQDLSRDHWIVTDATGAVVAAAEASRRRQVHVEGWVVVHPTWRRRGIGGHLADLVETRAGELVSGAPPGTQVTIEAWVNARRPHVREFVRARGYREARTFWRMTTDLDEGPPAPPVWPDGIGVRTMVPQTDARATYEATEEAFADHWGHVPVDFEEWSRRMRGDTFDPSLWFLAYDGDRIAGTALCSTFLGTGWIGTLGVRRPWRGRGLGEALLRHAFGEFHRRGYRRVSLGVDAQSLTGATRLYERAGMHADRVYELWVRVVREGRVLEELGVG